MHNLPPEPIAIVGSGCRLPGKANSPSRLWDLLQNPPDLITEIPSSRFNPKAFYHHDGEHHGCSNVDKSYLLSEDPAEFDASFFNINPREAEAMDPQQRLLLETVYEALESAGYRMEEMQGSQTSVFVGLMTGDYYDIQMRDTNSIPQYLATGTSRSIISNRVSYFFDFKGPSMTIDTACSSSLVAVHQAVQSLRNGESSVAVACGANLILGPEAYIYESKLHMLSPTGRSRMWDANADGYARGEGFAAVILKPLGAALRDGDHIESIIRETGVNQDGRTNGITMPSSTSQSALIRQTYARAGLDVQNPAERPQYFEAHGTGTKAGDPVEARAVSESFFAAGSKSEQPLFVGSIKTVIGHLEGAAGVAGLLKASLAVQNGQIPPNLLFSRLNPAILPFYDNLRVPTSNISWPALPEGAPRRASVNSFGFGGTNAHAIIEDFDLTTVSSRFPHVQIPSAVRNLQFFPGIPSPPVLPFSLSASTQISLQESMKVYSEYLKSESTDLTDLSWTLLQHRSLFQHRISFSGSSAEELAKQIDQKLSEVGSGPDGSIDTGATPKRGSRRILGVFTGQGAQWPGMGSSLIRSCPSFAETIHKLDQYLAELPDSPSWNLVEELQAPSSTSRIGVAEISQPACTALQIALIDLAHEAGISFHVVVGHSSGEIAAAYAAGLLSARDAICIAYYRGMHAKLAAGSSGEDGGMMATGYSFSQATVFCDQDQYEGRLSVAASNGPTSVTLSGDVDAIEEAKAQLDSEGVFARVLKVDTAYHSHHMERCAAAYLSSLQDCNIVPRRSNGTEWISSVYDSSMADQSTEVLKGRYWIQNMNRPVLFSQGVKRALQEFGDFDVALEIGPHATLKGPVSQTIKGLEKPAIPYGAALNRGDDDVQAFSRMLGFLWSNLDRPALRFEKYLQLFSATKPKMVKPLPSYQWQHDKRFWKESRVSQNFRQRKEPIHELLGSKTENSNEHQYQWKNLMRLRELPWVQHHSFQHQPLVPAAAYLSMALEAALILCGDAMPALVELSDLKIIKALTLDNSSAGIETMFSLNREESSEDNVINADFALFACPEEGSSEMVKHFSGRISITLEEPSMDALPPRSIQDVSMRSVDVDAFYSSLSAIGLDYTNMFRGITSIKRRMGEARSTVSRSTCTPPESKLLLHPALLDVFLQNLFAAFAAPGDGSLWTTYLPTTIEKLRVNTSLILSSEHEETSFVDSFTSKASSLSVVGDVEVFNSSGHMQIQIEGLACNSFTRADASNDRKLFSKTVWQPDVLSSDDCSEQVGSQPVEEEITDVCERASYFYFRNLRETIGDAELPTLRWHFQKLIGYTKFLSDRQVPAEWMDDTEDDIAGMLQRYPGRIDTELVHAVGSNLVDIVRNQKETLQVMKENDMLDRLYTEGIGFSTANVHVSSLVSQISHRYPHMDILEIGAGTGGTTRGVLEGTGHRFSSYHYTDVSTGFFENARQIFSSHVDKMTFDKLNIEMDIYEQGYRDHSFDLIVASNVLHATKTLHETLSNVRRLLKPGGYLVLMEITGEYLRHTAMMCGLSGWWLGEEDGRPYAPTITEVKWDALLRQTGFAGIDRIQQDHPVPSKHVMSVMVSQALDERVDALREPLSYPSSVPRTDRFVIVGGKTLPTSKIVHQIRTILRPWNSLIEIVDSLEKLEVVPSHTTNLAVLCLTDLDPEQYCEHLTAPKLEAIKSLFSHASHVLWSTQNCRSENSYSNTMVGLSRTLQFELPQLSLQLFDLENVEMPPAQIAQQLASAMLRLIMGSDPKFAEDLLWSNEPELLLQGDRVMIPRIVADEELNDRLNSARRQVVSDVDLVSEQIRVCVDAETKLWSATKGQSISKVVDAQREGSVVIRTKFSSLHAVRVLEDTFLYVCFGTAISTGQTTLALSESNASVITVPSSWAMECLVSDEDAPRFLWSVVCGLISRNILAAHTRPGTAAIFEPDAYLQKLLIDGAREANRKIAIVKSRASDAGSDGSIILHPFASKRDCQRLLPKDIVSSFDMKSSGVSLASTVSQFLPLAIPYSNSDFFATNPLVSDQFSEDLATSLLSSLSSAVERISNNGWPTCDMQILDVARLGSEKMTDAPSNTLLQWRSDAVIPVQIPSLDPTTLFASTKTYLLVGLTGELGQSLAQYMVMNGAKYIVLASRNPQVPSGWIEEMEEMDAVIKVSALDVSNRDSVVALHDEIKATLPPVGGVANAAMVLSDQVFAEMSIGDMEKVFLPKVNGTKYLDELYSDKSLDFFVMFSSLASVIGNPGQSNYNAANMFMISTARQRRLKGLAGSVINIGMIIGLGYLSRTGSVYERPLRKMGFMPISEREFQHVFAESIIAGKADSPDASELIIGLQDIAYGDNGEERPPWLNNPRFSHLVQPTQTTSATKDSLKPIVSIAEQLKGAKSVDGAKRLLQEAFVSRLALILQMSAESIKLETPLTGLGIDSLLAVDIRNWFLKELKVDVQIFKILGGIAVGDICSEVISNLPSEMLVSCSGTVKEVEPEVTSPPKDVSGSSETDSSDAEYHESSSGQQTPDCSSSVSSLVPSLEAKLSQEHLVSTPAEVDEPSTDDLEFSKVVPMSFGQSTMWFLRNYLTDPSTYNIAVQYTLRGSLSISRLEESIQEVIMRHESLRTCFLRDPTSKSPVQGVLKQSPFSLQYKSMPTDQEVDAEFQRLKAIDFNLSKGHALEAVLIKRSPEFHNIIFSYHHIIMDGVSFRILLEEIDKVYNGQTLAPVVHDFTNFAEKEKMLVESDQVASELAFWKNEFADFPKTLPLLPISKVPCRRNLDSYDTKTVSLNLSATTAAQIKSASRRLNVTPFQLYFSALQVFLYRLTGANDICIGIVDANRSDPDFMNTIGYLINTVAVRYNVDASEPFDKMILNARDKAYACMTNSKVPFDVLLDELKVPRSTSHSPLFQVLINYRLGALEQNKLGDCQLTDAKGSIAMTPYDLTLLVTETSKGESLLQFDVQNYLYSTEDAEQLLRCYVNMLESLSSKPSQRPDECELFSSAMMSRSIDVGKGVAVKPEWPSTLIEGIDNQIRQHPHAIAMKDAYGFEASYQNVGMRASAIARALQTKSTNISVVALLCEPSIDALCAMLAILRSGAMCVPLDLSNPVARLKAILKECRPQAILYHQQSASILEELGTQDVAAIDVSFLKWSANSSFNRRARPDGLAFQLYTSGTTGPVPKGVLLSHLSLSNVIEGTTKTLGLQEETVLQQSSLGFDLALSQIFLALYNGGKLVIAKRDQRGDAIELSKLMLDEKVTFTFCVPSEYSILLGYGCQNLRQCESWKFALSGGERLSTRLKQQFADLKNNVDLYNVYGPAETTLLSHIGKVDLSASFEDGGETYESAGYSLPNYFTYILDEECRAVPTGFPGEICIGGPSVSPGYTNNEELNARKFIRNPFATPSEISSGWDCLYRTGDKGRLLSDGSLIPLGRLDNDNQIKVRGMRVELDGVANSILNVAGGVIRDAVVLPRGQPVFLVGFVTFSSQQIPSDAASFLKTLLEQLPLPQYMRPSVLVPLPKFPRTVNGKVDRAALSQVTVSRQAERPAVQECLSESEGQLAAIWRDLLHEDEATPLKIYKDTDFFEVGGNSLLVVELQDRVRARFGVDVPLRGFFQASSLANMARLVSGGTAESRSVERIDWSRETAPELDLYNRAKQVADRQVPSVSKKVLLTGAFGFLGRNILQKLVEDPTVTEIHCVAIRQPSDGSERKPPVESPKIRVHYGDLSLPRLGLSESDFDDLARNIDIIIHNGAEVSFLKSYQSLRKVNVQSTKELVSLALPRRIPFHFVSTGGISNLLGSGKTLPRHAVPSEVTHGDGADGYVSSKWVNERYLENAAKAFDMPVSIHRPMSIIGDGAPATDLVGTIIAFSVKTQSVPKLEQWHGSFDMNHVNTVADQIVKTISNYEAGVHYHHEGGEVKVPVGELKTHVESKYSIECSAVELPVWIESAKAEGLMPVMASFLESIVGLEYCLPAIA